MLIEDVFIIERMEILNEGTDKNSNMKIRGVFQRADEENNNKRIYPKALLDREIEKLSESLSGRRLMGELDHPQHDSVKLSNVSHLITKLDVKGNDVIGEAEILNTPMGQVAKALIEGGVQVGISSRGMGTLSEGQDGKRYVNEDFRLITWDLVADPSTRGAYPTLAEGRQSILVEEILNDVLPRVTKQKVFSALLRERLTESYKGPTPEHIRAGDVIDTSTKEGREKVRKLQAQGAKTKNFGDPVDPSPAKKKASKKKASKKKASKKKADHPGQGELPLNTSTELFRGVRARLAEAGAGEGDTAAKREASRKEAEKRRDARRKAKAAKAAEGELPVANPKIFKRVHPRTNRGSDG